MNLIFISLLLNYLSSYSAADNEITIVHKDYKYIEQTRSYYKFHSPNTWADAKQICESECSSLWYPKNYNEVKAVQSAFKETNNVDTIYVGISDLDVEGTFKTIDDISIANVYNNWQVGQPDNLEEQDCVVIAPGRVLNDVTCSNKYNFICKLNEICAEAISSQCGGSGINAITDVSYRESRYIETAQARYNFHSPSSWRNAKMTCENEDSSLWYPKNRAEMRAIISLFKETQDFDWVYIGISDLDMEGNFVTIDGIPVEGVYNRWDYRQPDNYQEEDCVHIAPNSLLNDVDCEREYSFICKKSKQMGQNYNSTCNTASTKLNKNANDFYKDFQYMDETQTYYKLNSPMTWTHAQRKCDSEDSILWYPMNYEEAHAVLSLFKETQNFSGLYVGISDIVVDGIYETIDGTPITDVYDNWNGDQPNNIHGEDCVHISPDAKLIGISCKQKYPFVCKKTKRNVQEYNSKCGIGNLDTTNDYQYVLKTDAYYKYYTSGKWRDALRKCESDGSNFWYPQNSDEVFAVLSHFSPNHNFEWIYIGVTKLNGIFETTDGVPISKIYNSWAKNQPDNEEGKENCVHIGSDALLNDIDCSRAYPFVCKKTKNSDQACNKHDIRRLGYSYNEDANSWYKLHKNALNWTEAYKVCSKENSYLAVINSNMERKYLLDLFRGPDYDATRVAKNSVHLGFYNRLGLGWRTVKGTKLEDKVYINWAAGEADWHSQGEEEKCGSLSYKGYLYDIDCDTKSFFICEHDVEAHSS